MKKVPDNTQQGFAHVVAIIAIVFTVGAVGATGYYTYQKKADEKAANEQQARSAEQARLAKELADKKLLEEKKTPEPTEQPPTECVRDTTMYVTVSEGHRLRSSPDMNASGNVAIPYAAAVRVGCLEKGWYSADYNGQTGYAFGEYVSSQKPAAKPVSNVTNPTQAWCDSHGNNPFVVYAAKNPTQGFYHWSNPAGSLTEPIPFGTKLAETYCPAGGAQSAGYVLYNDAYFKFSDVSTTKP